VVDHDGIFKECAIVYFMIRKFHVDSMNARRRVQLEIGYSSMYARRRRAVARTGHDRPSSSVSQSFAIADRLLSSSRAAPVHAVVIEAGRRRSPYASRENNCEFWKSKIAGQALRSLTRERQGESELRSAQSARGDRQRPSAVPYQHCESASRWRGGSTPEPQVLEEKLRRVAAFSPSCGVPTPDVAVRVLSTRNRLIPLEPAHSDPFGSDQREIRVYSSGNIILDPLNDVVIAVANCGRLDRLQIVRSAAPSWQREDESPRADLRQVVPPLLFVPKLRI